MIFYNQTTITSILLLIFISDNAWSGRIVRKKKIVGQNSKDRNERLFKMKNHSHFEGKTGLVEIRFMN